MSDDYVLPGGGLDPVTQQMLMMLIAQSAQGGALNGLLPVGALDTLSFGFDPTGAQAQSFPTVPGTYNDRQVGSVEEGNKQANYTQDVMDLTGLGDIGLPAFGGLGGYSSDAFAPTVTNELIAQPATQQFQRYLDPANAGTFEGRVANVVANNGTVSDAVAKMRRVIEFADAHPDDEQAQADADELRPYLQTTNERDPDTFETVQVIDWGQVLRQAQDLADPYLAEQSVQLGPTGATYNPETGESTPGGEIVEIDGQLYRQTSEPSPLAEAYREAGIPLPTEEYSPADLLGPDWQNAEDAYNASIPAFEDQYAALQQDLDWANERATTLGQLSPDLFEPDAGVIPGVSAPMDHVTPHPSSPVGDIGSAILSNIGDRVQTGAGDVGLISAILALQGARGIGHGINVATGGIRGAIENIIGVDNQAQNTDPAAGAPVGVPAGAIAQAEAAGVGGGGAGGQGGPRSLAAGALAQSQPVPPGPGDPNSYLEYVLSAGPGRLSYDQWLAQRNQGMGATPGTPLPPLNTQDLAAIFSAGPLANLNPAELAQATGNRGVPQHYDYNTNTVTSNPGAGGQIDITRLPSTAEPTPVTGQYNTNTVTTPRIGESLLSSLPDGYYIHNGAIFNGHDQLMGYMPNPRTGPEPSEGVHPALTQQMLLSIMGQQQVSGNASRRGGPEPSETAGPRRSLDAQTSRSNGPAGPRRALDAQTSRSNGPVGPRRALDAQTSRTGAPTSWWDQLFPQTNPLRYGNYKERERAAPKANRQQTEVATARGRARRDDLEQRKLHDQQVNTSNVVYNHDYYRARGYFDALSELGITPTQVTLASRTGALRSTMGGK